MTEREGGTTDRAPRARVFWIGAAAGWALIAWGLRGTLRYHLDTRPTDLARFLVTGALLHDLVWAPLVLAAGVAVRRLVRPRWRAYVQAGLLVSGVLALFSYPEVRGYARALHNPTSLPRNYATNLILAITATWLVVAVLAVVAVFRRPAITGRAASISATSPGGTPRTGGRSGMGSNELVEFLRTWTDSHAQDLHDQGIAISLVHPHDPSALAVAVLFAEHHATTDVMGQVALSGDGLCLVELLNTESGETVYKSAATTMDEEQLTSCLNDFLARLQS